MTEAVGLEVKALEEAVENGQENISRLHRIGEYEWADGSAPGEHFIPVKGVLNDLEQSYKKLNKLSES